VVYEDIALVNYYKLNMRRLPLRTVWGWGKPLQFLSFVISFKLLRSQPPPQVLYPAEPALLRLEPSHDEAWLEVSVRELGALGFSLVGDHTAPVLGRASGRVRTFLSSDGKVIAGANSTVAAATLGSFSATSRHYAVGFWSVESSGRMLVTSSSVTSMPPVPGIDAVRQPGADASVLLPMHLRRVEGRPVRAFSPDQVYEQMVEQQARNIQHFVAIGLYEPATEDEVVRVRALPPA
jgi:hypothetical protein